MSVVHQVQEDKWAQYPVIAFLDSNVALECNALESLPWGELHKTGPILVVVCPTVLKEVDSKKSDSRLADHARRFNRTVGKLLGGPATVDVRQSPPPRVELALATCSLINWADLQNLDQSEPDSRFIAEVLNTVGFSKITGVVVSQDIRPLFLARQHDLATHHIGDNWLRPKEIAPAEKKLATLQRELDSMKAREPKIELTLRAEKSTVSVHRIHGLSPKERQQLRENIVRLNPIQKQATKQGFARPYDGYDHTYGERYAKWENETVPEFVNAIERKVELNFGQVEIIFRADNIGEVPAEELLICISVTGGWINDKYVFARPSGPLPPRPSPLNLFIPPITPLHNAQHQRQRGLHEFMERQVPKRASETAIECADFRHGGNYEYRMIVWLDPWAEDFSIDATVTASNLHGTLAKTISVEKQITECSLFEIVDPLTLEFLSPPETTAILDAAIRDRDFSRVELDS